MDDDCETLDDCVTLSEIHPFQPFTVLNYRVTPLRAAHDPAECCLIFLIEDEAGKTLLYGNDTAYFPEETWEHLRGRRLDLVSLDCTMGILGDGRLTWAGRGRKNEGEAGSHGLRPRQHRVHPQSFLP